MRTGLFIAGQYLRRVSIASDTRLFPLDHSRLINTMAVGPYVTAFNIDDTLFERTPQAALLLGPRAGKTTALIHYCIKLPLIIS